MNNNYTIIIIGEWESDNLGDKTLCTTYENLLKNLYPNIKTIRLDISSQLGVSFIKRIWGKILLKFSLYFPFFYTLAKNYNEHITQCSQYKILNNILKNQEKYVATVAGGALIQDYFAPSLSVIGELLEMQNIPIIYNALGIGSIKQKSSKEIFITLLNRKNIKGISTRDNLKELNFTQIPIKKIPDIAILCSHYYHCTKSEQKQIGFGVIDPYLYLKYSHDSTIKTIEEYDNLIISIIKKIYIECKLPIHLFSNGSKKDYLYAVKLCKKIGYQNVIVSPRPKNDLELISLINNFTFIFAHRLHASIIAYSFDIPTYGILWDMKVKYWNDLILNKNYGNLSSILNIDLIKLINEKQSDKMKKQKLELSQTIIQNIKYDLDQIFCNNS